MNKKIISYLADVLKSYRDVSDDSEFNAMEYSGGNFDDAFNIGVRAGKVRLAKQILSKIKENE